MKIFFWFLLQSDMPFFDRKKTFTQWLGNSAVINFSKHFLFTTLCAKFCTSLAVLWCYVTASEGKAALPLQPAAVADPTISLLSTHVQH